MNNFVNKFRIIVVDVVIISLGLNCIKIRQTISNKINLNIYQWLKGNLKLGY